MRKLKQCVCVLDFQKVAQQSLPKQIFNYIESGSEGEITKKQNQLSFHRLMIVPRILVSSSIVNLKTNLFGRQLNLPFGFSPWALNTLCHPDGENLSAKVAYQNNIAFTLSTLSTKSFEEISKQNKNGFRMMQMYISKNWQQTKSTVELAEKYGFTGLVITVDAQILGRRRKQEENKIQTSHIKVPIIQEIINHSKSKIKEKSNRSWLEQRDLAMNWQTISKIKSITKLKIILKGIMHPKDAEKAVDYCDAIWISNHGGRQLDSVSSTINILSMMKSIVKQRLPIFIDGGIRSGNDIFKCLALGANYVFFARPIAYSMSFGYEGLTKLVNILEDELKRTMILVGCKQIADISSKFIVPQPTL